MCAVWWRLFPQTERALPPAFAAGRFGVSGACRRFRRHGLGCNRGCRVDRFVPDRCRQIDARDRDGLITLRFCAWRFGRQRPDGRRRRIERCRERGTTVLALTASAAATATPAALAAAFSVRCRAGLLFALFGRSGLIVFFV